MLKVKNDPRQTFEPLNKAMEKVKDYINNNVIGTDVIISETEVSLATNTLYQHSGGNIFVSSRDSDGNVSYTLNTPFPIIKIGDNPGTVTPSITVGEDDIEMSYTVSDDKSGSFSGGSIELSLDDINMYAINGTETSTGLVNETKLKSGSIKTEEAAARAVKDLAAAGTILIGTVIIAGCVATDAGGFVLDNAAIPSAGTAIAAATHQLQPTLEAINRAFHQLSQSIQANAPSLALKGA